MGLTKFVEGSPRLRPAKECFHIPVRQAERGRTVTLSVLIPSSAC
jgi:hypothetical protein